MYNLNMFTLNKISHEIVEVIAEENVFAYVTTSGHNSVTVKFPGSDSQTRGCITHTTFPTNLAALNEVARIWLLINEAERAIVEALRSGDMVLTDASSQDVAR